MIESFDFPVRQFSDVLNQPGFVHGSDLLQHDYGRLHKSASLLQMVVGGQIRLCLNLCGNCRHNGCGAMPISNIVLDNHYRTVPVLLGTNPSTQVCIYNSPLRYVFFICVNLLERYRQNAYVRSASSRFWLLADLL